MGPECRRRKPKYCFNGTSTKTRIETIGWYFHTASISLVLMEHPPKQGLKQLQSSDPEIQGVKVLMEHPPKQGLKPTQYQGLPVSRRGFNGTSTKTRIETNIFSIN